MGIACHCSFKAGGTVSALAGQSSTVTLTGSGTFFRREVHCGKLFGFSGGRFGCLGNHEATTETEESLTRLFAAQGIHILRQERAPIRLRGETLNLIGVDSSHPDLQGVERLVMPGTVNILLGHNPNLFDRAVELGIDLTLAGHTHGAQVSLAFIHRGLCLSRLVTPYVTGWYEKPGGQLYVNRGIGTTAFPIRLGARPEITVFELTRGV